MLSNMRPEALEKLLASPTLHHVALNEQVRRDAAQAQAQAHPPQDAPKAQEEQVQ
jgi:hypothetical protein